MAFDLPALRISLYFTLALFSFILLALTGARLNYTEHLPRGDPLNGGHNFSDPVVGELLFTSLITMAWSAFIIYTIHKCAENKYVSTFAAELVGLFVLWLFWISGAAVATSIWGNLSFCQQFEACRVLSAMLAFTWLGWIVLSFIIGINLMFSVANGAFMEPLHGRWDPRSSQVMTPTTGTSMRQQA